jgi:hypothetical protein
MRLWSTLLIAAPVAAGLLAAPAARADWHHDHGWHGGWHGDRDWHHHDGGDAAAGALIGLGVGALIGGVIASQQQYYAPPPPVVYAPPPPYYAYGPRY